MKALFQQYKPFLLFLGKFFFAYFALTTVYTLYLNELNQVDLFTSNVASLSEKTAHFFNLDYQIVEDGVKRQYQVWYNKKYHFRIIEGCNAISVIILFIAFIVAFSGRIKPTITYIFFGSVFVYILNIFRIIILTVLIEKFPSKIHFLHGVLFPLIIYGIVFLLWFYWVNNYSKYAGNSI